MSSCNRKTDSSSCVVKWILEGAVPLLREWNATPRSLAIVCTWLSDIVKRGIEAPLKIYKHVNKMVYILHVYTDLVNIIKVYVTNIILYMYRRT